MACVCIGTFTSQQYDTAWVAAGPSRAIYERSANIVKRQECVGACANLASRHCPLNCKCKKRARLIAAGKRAAGVRRFFVRAWGTGECKNGPYKAPRCFDGMRAHTHGSTTATPEKQNAETRNSTYIPSNAAVIKTANHWVPENNCRCEF